MVITIATLFCGFLNFDTPLLVRRATARHKPVDLARSSRRRLLLRPYPFRHPYKTSKTSARRHACLQPPSTSPTHNLQYTPRLAYLLDRKIHRAVLRICEEENFHDTACMHQVVEISLTRRIIFLPDPHRYVMSKSSKNWKDILTAGIRSSIDVC